MAFGCFVCGLIIACCLVNDKVLGFLIIKLNIIIKVEYY